MLLLALKQQEAFSKIAAVFGPEAAARLEMIRLAGENGVVITPQVYMGNSEASNAVAAAIFSQKLQPVAAAK